MAKLGFIAPIGDQIDIPDSALAILPCEPIPLVEIEIVALLWEAPGGLTVVVGIDVIVELVQVID